MPSQTVTEATFYEKLNCIVGVLAVLFQTTFSALRYPFLSPAKSKSQPTFGREMTRLLLRRVINRLNIAQLQWVYPSSTVAYNTWITKKAKIEGAPAEVYTEAIGNEGAKLHWVGDRESKKVILHMHSGAYVMPLSPAHLNFISYVRKEVKRRSGVAVKTAFLEYTLLPLHKYPTQFRQAALALQHILDSGIAPGDIVISGDSAGGQLALQLLSHILHPHPSVPRIRISGSTGPLGGIVTISAWVILESSASSFVNNKGDCITTRSLLEWAYAFTDGTVIAKGKVEPEGFWGEAVKAPPEWWHDTAKATRSLLIVYGGYEALLDDNVALVKNIREGVAGTNADVTSMEEPKGLHIGPMIDALVGRPPSGFAQALAGWYNERLSGQNI